MTDGIIHKVFRKEINYYILENNRYMLDALTNIQTELIAEIEKLASIEQYRFEGKPFLLIQLSELIGDTE